MVYSEFSTDNADYVLKLVCHRIENKHVFTGIDALVIETGDLDLGWGGDMVSQALAEKPDSKLLMKYCKENHIPVFLTDNRGPEQNILWDLHTLLPILPLHPLLSFYTSSENSERKVNKIFKRLCSDYCFILQDPFVEGRNALNARKIEEFVAPYVKKITGKNKPRIGMIFGVAHMGLEYDLKSKRRRDFTLWNWKKFNFSQYSGFDRASLGEILELTYNGGEWKFKEFNVEELFVDDKEEFTKLKLKDWAF